MAPWKPENPVSGLDLVNFVWNGEWVFSRFAWRAQRNIKMQAFDLASNENWTEYSERFNAFFIANQITGEERT